MSVAESRVLGTLFSLATRHIQSRCKTFEKTNYILYCFLICLATGCKANDNSIQVKEYFSKLISKDEPIAVIDFSKTDSLLINDIENQIKIDLCNNANLTAQTSINELEISFPIYVMKNCDIFPSIHGVVEISINQRNEVLVNDEFVSANKDIFNKVLGTTKKMIKGNKRTHLLYAFDWDKKSNPVDIKNRLFQTLQAIKSYSDSLSLTTYNKPINKLSENEFDSLKNRFIGKIGFRGYFPPLPPPPKSE